MLRVHRPASPSSLPDGNQPGYADGNQPGYALSELNRDHVGAQGIEKAP
jgi:hypothetical protein